MILDNDVSGCGFNLGGWSESIIQMVLTLTKYTHKMHSFAACASGTFGNQCSSYCHCVNQTCNPVNGTCPARGCERGYKGSTCSTGT